MTFHTSIASEFHGEACDRGTPLLFIDQSLFLVSEFPKGVAQIFGISRGESLFSKGKVKNI